MSPPRVDRLSGAQAPRFSFVALVVTRHCNLSCSYCSAGAASVSRQGILSLDTIAREVPPVLASLCGSTVELHLTGGEPLLAGASWLDQALNGLEAAAGRCSRKLRITLQTNGTLLDDDVLAALRSHEVATSLSLDGPPPVNERFRSGTAATLRAHERLRGIGHSPGVIACLTRDSHEHLPSTLAWFEACGMHKVRLNPLLALGRGTVGESLTCRQVHASRLAILDFMLDETHHLRERNVLRVLERYVRHRRHGFTLKQACEGLHCPAGERLVALLPNGRWIPCPRYASHLVETGPTTVTPKRPGAPEWLPWVHALAVLDGGWKACETCPAACICDHGCGACHRGAFHAFAAECHANRLLLEELDRRWQHDAAGLCRLGDYVDVPAAPAAP